MAESSDTCWPLPQPHVRGCSELHALGARIIRNMHLYWAQMPVHSSETACGQLMMWHDRYSEHRPYLRQALRRDDSLFLCMDLNNPNIDAVQIGLHGARG